MSRYSALGAAVRIAHLSRPAMIGGGLLIGGAIAALAHLAGADVRGLTGGQLGLLAGLLPESSSEELRS